MTRFASQTEVTVEKSRAEIEATVQRYGADGYLSGWDSASGQAFLQFRMDGRIVKIRTRLPQPSDEGLTTVTKFEQAQRSHWRALLLLVKAKLEAVASGIVTLEEEFFPNVVMPDGGTVYEHAADKVALAYKTGEMPPLLPNYGHGPK